MWQKDSNHCVVNWDHYVYKQCERVWMCRVCSIRFQNDLMLMLCVIIYLVFIVVLVVLIVIKVMACTSHSKTQMFKYVSYKKKPLNEFLSYPNVTWRLTVRLYFKMNSNYTIWGDSFFSFFFIYGFARKVWISPHQFSPHASTCHWGWFWCVNDNSISLCRLNCKFPESLGIFNWNLSRILEFPFGLSRFVNHKKTRPHWFGRKLSQTENGKPNGHTIFKCKYFRL